MVRRGAIYELFGQEVNPDIHYYFFVSKIAANLLLVKNCSAGISRALICF